MGGREGGWEGEWKKREGGQRQDGGREGRIHVLCTM